MKLFSGLREADWRALLAQRDAYIERLAKRLSEERREHEVTRWRAAEAEEKLADANLFVAVDATGRVLATNADLNVVRAKAALSFRTVKPHTHTYVIDVAKGERVWDSHESGYVEHPAHGRLPIVA